MKTETNFLDVCFKDKNIVKQNFYYVDEHLGGTGSIDIVFKSDEEGVFKQKEMLSIVEKTKEKLLDLS